MQIIQCSSSFTRPNDTNQYTSGDLVSNSTSNTSVTPLTFSISYGRGLELHRVELIRSSTTVTDAQFRLHLYKDSPTAANGDNSAWSTTVSGYQGFVDIDGQTPAFTDDSRAYGVPVSNSVFAPMLILTDFDRLVYGLLEARDTYTPTAQEVFTVRLIGKAYV
jgi:hypothetical protein